MTEENTVTINGREYPSMYKPGVHWATDEAWAILDRLNVNALDISTRAYLAGQMAGAFTRIRLEAWKEGVKSRRKK